MCGTRYAVSLLTFCNLCAVKPLSIIPVCIIFPQLLYIFSGPEGHPYKQCIIMSDASFLKVSFYCVSCSEFLVLTHNIPRMMVSEKKIMKVP
jgi:hypothetical protein